VLAVSPNPVRLDEVDWIPLSLRNELERHRDRFEDEDTGDTITRESWFARLSESIEAECVKRGLVAFHCTREAEPGEIKSRGLRILSGGGDAHRAEFLTRHADKFTAEELQSIKREFVEVWGDSYNSRGRENRLCFALVHPSYWGSGGCKDLLGIYGGEAIYATWGRVGPIVDKLKTIGRPAVVHFRLDPRNIKTHVVNQTGRTAIWAWHNHIRSFEMGYWSEGRVTADVPAADILDVECWSPK
jgi:hypothetical protein